MRRFHFAMLALAGFVAIASTSLTTWGQRAGKNVYQTSRQPAGQNAAPGPVRVEELPPAGARSQPMPPGSYSDPFADEPFTPDGFHGYSYHDAYGGGPGGYACAEPSYGACASSGRRGQFFVTADYLYVEAGFSDALAFIDRQFVNGTTSFDFDQLDFEFESSYRVGGGYRLSDCGDEIRFLHTRFRSSAEDELTSEAIQGVGFRHIIPFKPPQFPGGRVDIEAEVDVKSFDVECAKTIPLCMPTCCDCGDPCGGQCDGCCDPCGRMCPLWDITVSAGVRYAEADWERSWTSFNTDEQEIGSAEGTMDFQGVGAKVGIEGRRYFFQSGWLSAYAKGDLSLLWGELEFETLQQDQLDLPTEITVSNESRQIIPVTELEAGVTAQVTCNSRFSGGYLLSAWHDLGYRDDFVNDITFPIVYDDANILGFHGWFVRAEIAY